MSELRLVPAALLCWATTWTVLATRNWVCAALIGGFAITLAYWWRATGQAIVLFAVGITSTLIAQLRVHAGSQPAPPILEGRITDTPKAVGTDTWLIRVAGETIFYRAEQLSGRAGDTVRLNVTEKTSTRIGTHDHILYATDLDITHTATGIRAWLGGVRDGFYGASISEIGDPLLPAMVLGDTRGITTELYADVGLAHLSAVSGSNVAIVTGAVLLVARALTLSPRIQTASAATALGLFVLLIGYEPSVLRAAVSGSVALVAVVSHSRAEPIHSLSLGIIGLILYDSNLAANYGFVLSVAATAGIVALNPLLMRSLGASRLPAILVRCLAVAIAAELVTLPIVALMSGRMPLVSVLANILVAPVVAPITILGMLAILLPGMPRTLLLWAARPLTWWIDTVAHTLRRWEPLDLVPGWLGIYGVGLLCLWVLALIWWRRWRTLSIGLVSCLAMHCKAPPPGEIPLEQLQVDIVHVLDTNYQPPHGTQAIIVLDPSGTAKNHPSALPDGTPVLYPNRDGPVTLHRDGSQHAADGRF